MKDLETEDHLKGRTVLPAYSGATLPFFLRKSIYYSALLLSTYSMALSHIKVQKLPPGGFTPLRHKNRQKTLLTSLRCQYRHVVQPGKTNFHKSVRIYKNSSFCL
ncbi:hypothetical protein HK25_00585 [Acetobacter sp. DsW_059]|nr:hypothetical protein HK25_00585 [Acetobacter sp. DsW_059]